MKTRHTIYNSIGLGLAALACFSLLGRLVIIAVNPRINSVIAGLQIVIDVAFILCVGGGALLNMLRHRYSTRPTIAMVVAYFISVIFIPLGIWGMLELRHSHKGRRGRAIEKNIPVHSFSPVEQTTPFAYHAAQISWICGALGFCAFTLGILSHVRTIRNIVIPIVAFAMIFSLVLGIVALFGIRKYGPRKILMPALVGTVISGSSALFIIAALVIGLQEGALESKNHHPSTTNSAPQPSTAH